MSSLRKLLHTHNFNLTNTVEAVEANAIKKKLKHRRNGVVHRCNPNVENFSTTTNIEFLKEVSRKFDLNVFLIN